jgi:hypothetical protein
VRVTAIERGVAQCDRDGTWNDIDAATPALCLDEEARRVLVNTRLHPQLLDPLLRFMYREENKASVPPTLRLAPTSTPQFAKEVRIVPSIDIVDDVGNSTVFRDTVLADGQK